MAAKALSVSKFFNQGQVVVCALLVSLGLIGQGVAALSGSTERIREMIAEHDFRGIEPAMDAQQQFIVFSPDQRFSGELLDIALTLRQRLYRFFGISKIWDQPAFILVFPSEKRYGIRGTGGAAVLFRYRGQYVRMIGSYLQEGLKDRILPHEICHFLIADLSSVGSGREGRPPELPVFINEGIAEYFTASPGKRVLFERTVWERLQAGKLEPFNKVVTSTATWVEALRPGESFWVQRAQAYSAVSFLASLPNGSVKLRNYIFGFGASAGRVPRESASLRAFETAFRLDYSSWRNLQQKWVQFIRDREIVIVEAESASVVESSGEASEVKRAPKKGLWLSGGKQVVFRASQPGSFVTLRSPFDRPGAFDVFSIYTQSPRSGEVRLTLNGKPFPGTFDGYAERETVWEPVYHGKASLGSGPLTARFSVTGKAPQSRGFEVAVDCLLLRRDPRQEARNRALAQRYFQAGTRNYRQESFVEAEANFTRALEVFPAHAPALEWRAHTRMALGRVTEAEQDVDAAMSLAPDRPGLRELKTRIKAARDKPK